MSYLLFLLRKVNQLLMKNDYNQELINIINNLGDSKPKLLLHSCCGPCSSAVIERLRPYFQITVFYYNPNIEPEAEYLKRQACQIELLDQLAIPYLAPSYDHELFQNTIKDQELVKENHHRCALCINLRLSQTAQKAKTEGFAYFGTTLTISPHQDAQLINQIGLKLALEDKINFLPADFKKQNGYQRSIELSNKYHLYRQNYCGCLASKKQP